MFNTVMGGCAGLALLLAPRLFAPLSPDGARRAGTGGLRADPAGFTVCFAVLGAVLTTLGFVLTVGIGAPADPLGAVLGGPWLLAGVLLLAAAWHLGRHGSRGWDVLRLRAVLAPVSWIVCWLGVALAFCAAAIIRFELVTRPHLAGVPQQPLVRDAFFAVPQYGLAALGCVLVPVVVYRGSRAAWLTLSWSWTISGVCFAAFSALNVYTLTAVLIGRDSGSGGRW